MYLLVSTPSTPLLDSPPRFDFYLSRLRQRYENTDPFFNRMYSTAHCHPQAYNFVVAVEGATKNYMVAEKGTLTKKKAR